MATLGAKIGSVQHDCVLSAQVSIAAATAAPRAPRRGKRSSIEGTGMTIAIRSAEIASVEATDLNPRMVAGRECGTCTLCCKVAAVEELNKPNGVWCSHCLSGKRCTIYDQRPQSCRSFYC